MSGRPPPTPAAGTAGEIPEENWGRRKKLVVSCHQTAREQRLYRHQTHTSRSDPESAAMPDHPAGHEPELLTIAEEEGLYVIARPGPYINAEISMGASPPP